MAFTGRPSVMPDLIRHPATARLRREGVFYDQGLDRAGPRTKSGVTVCGCNGLIKT